jgi:hypothetical protein
MKKILIILSIFLAVCLTLGAASAFDLSFDFSAESSSEASIESDTDGGQVDYEDGELTIGDLDFNIPEGYKENSTLKKVGVDAGENFKGFLLSADGFDKGNDYIIVKVIFEDDDMDNDSYTPSEDSVAKEIAGYDGYFSESNDEVVFDYLEDGKLVEVTAPDENVLTSVIS